MSLDAGLPGLVPQAPTASVAAADRGGTGIARYSAGNFLRAASELELEQRTPAQVRADIGAAAASHTHAPGDIDGITGPAVIGRVSSASGPASAISPAHSVALDATGLRLVGDVASPGNNRYYGTNASGTRGWYDLPSGGGGGQVFKLYWQRALEWAGEDVQSFCSERVLTHLQIVLPTTATSTALVPHIHHFGGHRIDVNATAHPSPLSSSADGFITSSYGFSPGANSQHGWGFGSSPSGHSGLMINLSVCRFFMVAVIGIDAAPDTTDDYWWRIGLTHPGENWGAPETNSDPAVYFFNSRTGASGNLAIGYRTGGGFGPVTVVNTGVAPVNTQWMLLVMTISGTTLRYRVTGMTNGATVTTSSWSNFVDGAGPACFRRLAGSATRRLLFQRLEFGFLSPEW